MKRMTRRHFLERLGRAASGNIVHDAMLATGLLTRSPYRGRPAQQPPGAGKRVVILGAGVAGLTAAYELDKLAYTCIVLEARQRVGGRCWTVRRGDQLTEVLGYQQTCEFDEGLFYNPGASRIHSSHYAVLDYCREFAVAMDAVINVNHGAYFYSEDIGPLSRQPIRQRRALVDMQGYTAELLAKAVQQGALDEELTAEDAERLVEYLRVYGDLSEDLFYRGSPRRGYRTPPGAGQQPGEVDAPFDLSPLLESNFWRFFGAPWSYDQQMTMLAPVEGMDAIPRAFEQRIGHLIRYNSQVRHIGRTQRGVRVLYQELATQEAHTVEADLCICTIPLSVLAYIPGDYPAALREAIRNVGYATGVRIGVQFAQRFWEAEGIYGGMTWTDQTIRQIMYPDTGLGSGKGVLVAAYSFGKGAWELSGMTPADRIERTLTEGAKVHPNYRDFYENGFSVAWNTIPHNLGCFAAFSELARKTFYPALLQSDGYIYLAGDHMSYLSGWMEGAVLSGQAVAQKIHERTR
jgi:monoamine oxidase